MKILKKKDFREINSSINFYSKKLKDKREEIDINRKFVKISKRDYEKIKKYIFRLFINIWNSR